MLMTAAIHIRVRSKRSFSEFLDREIIRSKEGGNQEAEFCVTLGSCPSDSLPKLARLGLHFAYDSVGLCHV